MSGHVTTENCPKVEILYGRLAFLRRDQEMPEPGAKLQGDPRLQPLPSELSFLNWFTILQSIGKKTLFTGFLWAQWRHGFWSGKRC